jgi:ABC-type phosphate transport system permease subunit
MTAYIVQVSLGDTPRTIEYKTIFAVGMMLFVTTLALNLISQYLRELQEVRMKVNIKNIRLLAKRYRTDFLFRICAVAMLLVALGTWQLLVNVLMDGAGRLGWSFLNFPSRKPENAGVLSSLVRTYLMLLTAAISLPIGVAAAVYLRNIPKDG